MIERLILKSAVVVCSLVLLTSTAFAQTKKKKDEPEFIDKVWVGGSINNNLQFGGGAFAFGITPMAGYEIVPFVSIGPLLRMDYHYERITFNRPYITYSAFDIGPGVFARADVIRNVFLQVEYEHAFIQAPVVDNGSYVLDPNNPNKVLKETEIQNYVYVGAGYATGSNVRYGISIHYNILDDFNYIRLPWDYRIAIRVQL